MKNPRFWKILSRKIHFLTSSKSSGKSIYTARLTQTEMNELLKVGARFEQFHAMQSNYVKGCMKRGDSFKSTYTFTVPLSYDFFYSFLPIMRNDVVEFSEYNLTA